VFIEHLLDPHIAPFVTGTSIILAMKSVLDEYF
jgi:hypothetical protein